MQDDYSLGALDALMDQISGSDPGIRAVFIINDGACRPPNGTIESIAALSRALDADAIALEREDGTLVMACDRSSAIYAAAQCRPGIDVKAVAIALHVRLAAGLITAGGPEVLPAGAVRSALGRWEWQLSQAFGARCASRLVARALAGRSPGRLTREQLDGVRRALLARTGSCVDLAESR